MPCLISFTTTTTTVVPNALASIQQCSAHVEYLKLYFIENISLCLKSHNKKLFLRFHQPLKLFREWY